MNFKKVHSMVSTDGEKEKQDLGRGGGEEGGGRKADLTVLDGQSVIGLREPTWERVKNAGDRENHRDEKKREMTVGGKKRKKTQPRREILEKPHIHFTP